MDLIYVYHDECEPCKELDPLLDQLVEDGYNIRRVEWEDVVYSKFNVLTPAFYIGEHFIDAHTVWGALSIINNYPELFKDTSKLNVLKHILNNPKPN